MIDRLIHALKYYRTVEYLYGSSHYRTVGARIVLIDTYRHYKDTYCNKNDRTIEYKLVG